MKYVLYPTVAARWYVPQLHFAKALRLRLDFRLGQHEFLASDHLPIECGELLLRASRNGVISEADCDNYLVNLFALGIVIHPTTAPLLCRASALAHLIDISVSDGLYLALAEQENCALLTDDQVLLQKAAPHFPFVVDFATLP